MFAVFASVQDQSYNKGVFITYPVRGGGGGARQNHEWGGGQKRCSPSFTIRESSLFIPLGEGGARQNHEEGQKRLKCFLGRKGLGGSFLFQHS